MRNYSVLKVLGGLAVVFGMLAVAAGIGLLFAAAFGTPNVSSLGEKLTEMICMYAAIACLVYGPYSIAYGQALFLMVNVAEDVHVVAYWSDPRNLQSKKAA